MVILMKEKLKGKGAEAQRILLICLKGHTANEYRARNRTLVYVILSIAQNMLAVEPQVAARKARPVLDVQTCY